MDWRQIGRRALQLSALPTVSPGLLPFGASQGRCVRHCSLVRSRCISHRCLTRRQVFQTLLTAPNYRDDKGSAPGEAITSSGPLGTAGAGTARDQSGEETVVPGGDTLLETIMVRRLLLLLLLRLLLSSYIFITPPGCARGAEHFSRSVRRGDAP